MLQFSEGHVTFQSKKSTGRVVFFGENLSSAGYLVCLVSWRVGCFFCFVCFMFFVLFCFFFFFFFFCLFCFVFVCFFA